jgi:hypothetical protein
MTRNQVVSPPHPITHPHRSRLSKPTSPPHHPLCAERSSRPLVISHTARARLGTSTTSKQVSKTKALKKTVGSAVLTTSLESGLGFLDQLVDVLSLALALSFAVLALAFALSRVLSGVTGGGLSGVESSLSDVECDCCSVECKIRGGVGSGCVGSDISSVCDVLDDAYGLGG